MNEPFLSGLKYYVAIPGIQTFIPGIFFFCVASLEQQQIFQMFAFKMVKLHARSIFLCWNKNKSPNCFFLHFASEGL